LFDVTVTEVTIFTRWERGVVTLAAMLQEKGVTTNANMIPSWIGDDFHFASGTLRGVRLSDRV
jgi:hypothetical protein